MQIAGNWRRRALLAALLALAAAITLLLVLSSQHATGTTSAADHLPADKVTVSANTATVSGPGQDVTLLTGRAHRTKRFRLGGLAVEEADAAIERLFPPPGPSGGRGSGRR